MEGKKIYIENYRFRKMAVLNCVLLRTQKQLYLIVPMRMEMWWFMSCKFKSLFKPNGLNFIYFIFLEREREKTDKIHSKYKSSLHCLLLFYFGKGRSPSQQPCMTKKKKQDCVFSFHHQKIFIKHQIFIRWGARYFRRVSHLL